MIDGYRTYKNSNSWIEFYTGNGKSKKHEDVVLQGIKEQMRVKITPSRRYRLPM